MDKANRTFVIQAIAKVPKFIAGLIYEYEEGNEFWYIQKSIETVNDNFIEGYFSNRGAAIMHIITQQEIEAELFTILYKTSELALDNLVPKVKYCILKGEQVYPGWIQHDFHKGEYLKLKEKYLK